ncbi:hypothetical protein BGX21_005867 [Mortierella sp. AD011]|nr:hypothetical protein BGX20_011516 [Mortierella sp. AD010]KAF9399641.1 hypothetical protein BGX21_005867 [Mortierella sp. AD011]
MAHSSNTTTASGNNSNMPGDDTIIVPEIAPNESSNPGDITFVIETPNAPKNNKRERSSNDKGDDIIEIFIMFSEKGISLRDFPLGAFKS